MPASKKATKVSKPEKELFCHQYWKKMADKGVVKETNNTSVSLHGYLHGINHHLIKSPYPEHMDSPFMQNLTPRQMITKSDIEFKTLTPLQDNLTVYRCIGEKPEFFSEYKLYKQRLNIKPNDIIDMKEYAYAASNVEYARHFLPNNRGILYQIEIPKGAKISSIGPNDSQEIVFPRSSKFQCIGTQNVQNENENYLNIKLKYILPEV